MIESSERKFWTIVDEACFRFPTRFVQALSLPGGRQKDTCSWRRRRRRIKEEEEAADVNHGDNAKKDKLLAVLA